MLPISATAARGILIAFALAFMSRVGGAQSPPEDAGSKGAAASAGAATASAAPAHETEHGVHGDTASTQQEGTEHPEHAEHGGAHAEHEGKGHHRFHIRFIGTTGVGIFGSQVGFVGGGGLALEVILISGWLELELGVSGLSAEHGFEYAADLYAIKPFHINSWFHPFVGLGLSGAAFRFPVETTATEPSGIEAGFIFGPSAIAGIDFWLNRRIALFLRADYTAYFLRPMPTHEIAGAYGFVLGF
jgi:hypothetical protein